MRLNLNWLQRGLLIFGGLFFVLFGMKSAEGYGEWDGWLATIKFALALGCFVLAAQSRSKSDG